GFVLEQERIGQDNTVLGGLSTACQSRAKSLAHGHFVGRCRISFLARWAIRAGMPMMRVRSVWARTLLIRPPMSPAAARSRLCVIAAIVTQAALALNTPEGICAKAPFFNSAWICSMIACLRWT